MGPRGRLPSLHSRDWETVSQAPTEAKANEFNEVQGGGEVMMAYDEPVL